MWGELSWGEFSMGRVVLGRVVFGASCPDPEDGNVQVRSRGFFLTTDEVSRDVSINE